MMFSTLLVLATAAALPIDRVEASLQDYALRTCNAVNVEVVYAGVSRGLPGGPDVALQWEGDACSTRPTLRLLAVEEGERLGRWTVRPHLRVWVEAPVAAQLAMPGDLVEVLPGQVQVDSIIGRPVTNAGPHRARVRIEAGEPVTHAVVEPVPDVASGSHVTVRVQRGALVVTAPGTLMQDARIGDMVRVTNDATRVVLKGRLSRTDLVDLL
jgi:flagella basal body P-ring formation protein FlgA